MRKCTKGGVWNWWRKKIKEYESETDIWLPSAGELTDE